MNFPRTTSYERRLYGTLTTESERIRVRHYREERTLRMVEVYRRIFQPDIPPILRSELLARLENYRSFFSPENIRSIRSCFPEPGRIG